MPSYLETFHIFLSAGGFSVGNGYAALDTLRRKMVVERSWLSEEDFSKAVATAEVMPGVFSINLGAHLGYRLKGWGGSISAIAGVLLPPFFVMLLLLGVFGNLRENPHVASFLKGVRPAIVALVAISCLRLLRSSGVTLSTVWLPLIAALGIWLLNISPVIMVAAIVAAGILYALFIRINE